MPVGFNVLCLLFLLFQSAQASHLDQKLRLQWQKYADAQQELLQSVRQNLPPEQRLLSRAHWENILTLTGPDALTAADRQELRLRQALRIEKARIEARQNSVIDLDIVRTKNQVAQFCSQAPKGAMLHIHPGGTFDRGTVADLMQSLNPKIELQDILSSIEASNGNSMLFSYEKAWLQNIPEGTPYLSLSSQDQEKFRSYLFLPPGKQTFPRFNSVFYFLDFVTPDWGSYEKALMNFARKAVQQGVFYVEFTTGFSLDKAALFERIEKNTGLMIRINHSFNRTQDATSLHQRWQQLMTQTPHKSLVGIDFLDNEETNPAFEKGQLLYGLALDLSLQSKTSLHRTMHSGELGDIRNPRDAMILGSERLGHAVQLAKDEVALEYASLQKIPIEVNLSSNLRLTDVQTIKDHPFLRYLRLGIPISLSTDDEGIFDTDINQECELAVRETDLSYAEFKGMALNSIEASFAEATDKKILKAKLEKAFQNFEAPFKMALENRPSL